MASSSNNNKRKAPSDFNDNPSSPKRRMRRRPRSKRPRSKVFCTKGDLEQFQQIFHAVKYSELASNSSTPISVIQEIAEYGTGMVFDCAVSECSHKVVVLRGDATCSSCFCLRHESYQHDLTADRECFYCSACKLLLESCALCGRWNYLPECTQCTECTVAIYDCLCGNERSYEYHCGGCSGVLCSECGLWCDHCHERICTKCWAHSGRDRVAAYQCTECRKSIPLPHRGCDVDCAVDDYFLCGGSEFRYCDEGQCPNIVCLSCYEMNAKQWAESDSTEKAPGFCGEHQR